MRFEVTQIKSMIVNAYLLTGEHVALVDTLDGMGYGKIQKALRGKGLEVPDVEFILITHHHSDHAKNAAKIKRLSGATLIAGAQDAPVIEGAELNPSPSHINRLGRFMDKMPRSLIESYQSYERVGVDRKATGGELIQELGLEVVAVPGHTSGGVCFLDREGRRAFIGDMVSYFRGKPGMPSLSFSEGLDKIKTSQELLAGLGLDIAYPGHGNIIQPDASRKIADFVEEQKAKGAYGS
jgi:glyoxylase-like metal-dependent hydrolase (beta-lactamase superfamily II)